MVPPSITSHLAVLFSPADRACFSKSFESSIAMGGR